MLAIKLKNWCLENITPQSWSRIVLRALPQLREKGFELKDLEYPEEDLKLNEDVLSIIEQTMDQLYQLKIDETVLK